MLVLTDSGIDVSSRSNGWRITSSSRSAISSGATFIGAPSISTTNSSPPIRPIVSASRSALVKPRGDRDQQPVAGFVAERVVHVLEVVEVDEQRCTGRSRSGGSG